MQDGFNIQKINQCYYIKNKGKIPYDHFNSCWKEFNQI